MSKLIPSQKRHASAGVQQLIHLANSVAPQLELPDPSPATIRELRTKEFARFRKLTGPVKPDTFLQKLIGRGEPKTFNAAIGRYLLLKNARDLLRTVARIGELSRSSHLGLGLRGPRWGVPRTLRLFLTAETDEHGRINFGVNPIVQALQGVDAARIRVCAVCGIIFWAARKDQCCCTKRCTHVLRSRRWREKYQQIYKQCRDQKALQAAQIGGDRDVVSLASEGEELSPSKVKSHPAKKRSPRLPNSQP